MAFLTIIVPVYNKGKYLKGCIESILEQDFRDFELILVNDGSTDNSGQICDESEKTDQRIKVVHQANGGVSSARNKGLAVASGQYISFVDADDTIDKDMHQILIENALESKADISACGVRVIFPHKVIDHQNAPSKTVMNHAEGLRAAILLDLNGGVYNKIYKSSIAKNIRFIGRMYEDVYYVFQAYLSAEKSIYDNRNKYNYIVRDNSVSMSPFSEKYLDVITVSDNILRTVARERPGHLEIAKSRDLVNNLFVINLIFMAGRGNFSREYGIVIKNLKAYKDFVKKSKLIRLKRRVAYQILMKSEGLYHFIMYVYCLVKDSPVVKRYKNN